MPKVSPMLLKRVRPTLLNPTFKSSDGSLEFTMSLRKLSTMEILSATEFAQKKEERYVGKGEEGSPDYKVPEFLPPIDGQPVLVSSQACLAAAILWRAQTCEDADRYTWEEIVSFMVDDAILEKMSEIVNDLKEVQATPDPLDKPDSTSSEPVSITEPVVTPE